MVHRGKVRGIYPKRLNPNTITYVVNYHTKKANIVNIIIYLELLCKYVKPKQKPICYNYNA